MCAREMYVRRVTRMVRDVCGRRVDGKHPGGEQAGDERLSLAPLGVEEALGDFLATSPEPMRRATEERRRQRRRKDRAPDTTLKDKDND